MNWKIYRNLQLNYEVQPFKKSINTTLNKKKNYFSKAVKKIYHLLNENNTYPINIYILIYETF